MSYPIVGFCLSNTSLTEQSSSVPVVCNKACLYSRYAETLIHFRRWLRGTWYALRTRNTYLLVSQLRRMFFEWQGILQFISQRGFSFDSVSFSSFTVHCCFMAILKADKRRTKSQIASLYKKNLHYCHGTGFVDTASAF